MPRLAPRAALLGAVLTFLAGCGGAGQSVPLPNYGSEDGLKIAQLVSVFNDTRGDQRKFKKVFAGEPTGPLKQYEKYVYEVEVGSPRVDGAAATATVRFLNDSNNELVTTKQWTFTKVGDEWKIKSAPL